MFFLIASWEAGGIFMYFDFFINARRIGSVVASSRPPREEQRGSTGKLRYQKQLPSTDPRRQTTQAPSLDVSSALDWFASAWYLVRNTVALLFRCQVKLHAPLR